MNAGVSSPPNHLRFLRRARGMSQLELAKRAQLSWDTVAAVDRGARVPYPGTQEKLASVFGLQREDVFPEESDE
jgi:DNA-binding XRE family transcriptional regulator